MNYIKFCTFNSHLGVKLLTGMNVVKYSPPIDPIILLLELMAENNVHPIEEATCQHSSLQTTLTQKIS